MNNKQRSTKLDGLDGFGNMSLNAGIFDDTITLLF